MSNAALVKLSRLLDVERDALLAGDLEKVGALAEEKEALANAFDENNAQGLQSISKELVRNSVLLAAAREGVNAVQTMLNKQSAARSTLSSYDSNGKATTIAQSNRGTERRF